MREDIKYWNKILFFCFVFQFLKKLFPNCFCSSSVLFTKVKCQVYLKQWDLFCHKNNIQRPALSDAIRLLVYLFEKVQGHGYLSIACARSPLPNMPTRIKGIKFGKCTLVVIFMEGVFHLKPSLPFRIPM